MPKKSLKALAAAAVLGLISAQSAGLFAFDEPVGVARINDGTTYVNGDCECEGGQKHCHLPLAAFVHPDGVTYSPGHGFRRPEVIHIQRNPVEYRRYWPSKWYGEPGSAIDASAAFPMVYTPTDTTQLGFYYQRVPTWRPNPAMIPPRPWPSQWHRREIGPGYYGTYGEVITTEPVQSAPQEISPPIQSQPVAPPATPVVPPAPQAFIGPAEDPGI